MSRKPNGFSLIELLMVVTIILVIAALAIPSFMRSRISANETSAVASLRAIFTANTTYETSYGNGYSPDLLSLAGTPPATCQGADLIDGLLASGQKSGYSFTYIAGPVVGGGRRLYTRHCHVHRPGHADGGRQQRATQLLRR